MPQSPENKPQKTTLLQLYCSFFCIGILTFGGGLAMLPMFRRECVERFHWVTDSELLDLYAISQCTPGIIATNSATYIGYKMRKTRGSVAATLGVISPSVIIICLIAALLRQYVEYPVVQHAFAGIRIAVCAMLITTVVTVAKKGIKNAAGLFLFAAGFALACFTPIPLVLIVILSGAAGLVLSRVGIMKAAPSSGSKPAGAGRPETEKKEDQP